MFHAKALHSHYSYLQNFKANSLKFNILKISKLSAGYKNFKIFVDKLEVSENQKVVILGPNGSGKTTLIRTLLKQIDYSGSVKIYSKELRNVSQEELIKYCSFLLQVEYQPEITVKTYLKLSNVSLELDLMEIKDLLDRKMNELSAGEAQRVRLSRVINSAQKILILDEPLSHLDPYFQIKLLQYIKNEKRTFILTIHDIFLATKFFNNFILMKSGKIQAKVLNEETFREVFNLSLEVFKV